MKAFIAVLPFAVGLAASVCLVTRSVAQSPSDTTPVFYGPIHYESFADSPFAAFGISFYLEDFEDGLLSVPGVTAINNNPGGSPLGALAPSYFTDSVDLDDGVDDGFGTAGHSLAPTLNDGGESFGITFMFDAGALGGLPAHVGVVWTDGSPAGATLFEAFGPGGLADPLGTVGPVVISDGSFFGTTADDHFFGVSSAAGISAIKVSLPNGVNTMELDHLQYTLASAFTDLGFGLAGSAGEPHLAGAGTLLARSAGSLALSNAAASAPALLFVSVTSTPAPFKGGTLVPVPVLLGLSFSTDVAGAILLPWTSWPSGLTGQTVFLQCAIKDAAAVKGVALSNALHAYLP